MSILSPAGRLSGGRLSGLLNSTVRDIVVNKGLGGRAKSGVERPIDGHFVCEEVLGQNGHDGPTARVGLTAVGACAHVLR